MKKYKNIFLILLVVLEFSLNNYNINNKNDDNKKDDNLDNKFSYIVNYTKYDLSNDYIYVGDDTDSEILFGVSILSAEGKIEDGYLKFYQWDYVLTEFLLVRFSLDNLKVYDKTIVLEDNITYDEFISNIKTENAIYKLFNGEEIITSGNITSGMQLKVYYNDEIIDTYNITDEYLSLGSLNIRNEKYIIRTTSTVSSLKKQITTTGNIIFQDKEGNLLEDNKYLTTASNLKIELSNKTYEYTIVILGDVTGSGDIFIGDISKLYQYYKGIINMEECYIMAGDIVYDGLIEINDIAKLYQYYKGTINSL